MLNEKETLELLRLAKSGSEQAKEKLLVENSSLLKCIVKRYLHKGVEYDDLMQLGSIGFLKAIQGFDERFGVRLSTYAVPMIAGEIKRFMRDDGTVKVSRTLKRLSREIRNYMEEHSAKNGDPPTIKQISEAMGIDEGEVLIALDACRMPVSIYEQGEYKDEKTGELVDRLPVKDTQEEMIEKLQLHQAIEELPERERKIIVLRFFRDLTQSEVAERVGVSQVQVSRIETKIMKEFKEKLKA